MAEPTLPPATVKLVDALTGSDIPGASVNISLSPPAFSPFIYADLVTPVTLAAGRTFYLVTQEIYGGDFLYSSPVCQATRIVARPVLESAGIRGPPGSRGPPEPGSPMPLSSGVKVNQPNVFAASEEHLALKLVSTRVPVEVLVIDHVERPEAN